MCIANIFNIDHFCCKASDLTKQLLTFAKGGDPVKKPWQLPGW